MVALNRPPASTGSAPEPKLASKLIVLAVFDRDEEGGLQPAFEPREMPDERRAVATAQMIFFHDVGFIDRACRKYAARSISLILAMRLHVAAPINH